MTEQQKAKLKTIINKVDALMNDDNLDAETWIALSSIWSKLDQIKNQNDTDIDQ